MTTVDASVMRGRASPENRERIRLFKEDKWIGYEGAILLRGEIENLLDHPKTHRMPGMALIGESNSGKSMILSSVKDRANPPFDPNASKITLPVMLVQTPPSADEGRLYSRILENLGLHVADREPEDAKLRRIRIVFEKLEVQMLIMDDFLNIASSSISRRRRFLNALRNLSVELAIPIVVSGTPEIQNILAVDASIANRFKPIFVRKWHKDRLEEFARFVLTIMPRYQLKGGMEIMQRKTLENLLMFSEGLLGEAVEILELLAEWAVRSGTEKVTADLLTRENLYALGYVMPSDRTRQLAE
ncbi:TniB family NTP-binding protein (plasmid) [Pseudomonas sp. BYT-5]|uniref:TniB family NTP-binding protein n=1 Tax=unclassified Pseudomonas TaxID=196821 RepID=UPI0020211769|nr:MULTISPECIES: TniB family NTP-binding protein [unclassified Pseudomonas]URD45476.1 TniB family NTP-binding protein [Pseudomonas sp. BYT-5]URL00698.1 TniB family NTP-binding protein [Pseudomonas sp. BYT-1]